MPMCENHEPNTKQFYSFADGVKISDTMINEWLWNLRQAVLQDGKLYSDTSSGDTCVSVMVWSTLIEFNVATSDGYASIKFANKDELMEWTPQFKREIFGRIEAYERGYIEGRDITIKRAKAYIAQL
jgi:hypothetical protein